MIRARHPTVADDVVIALSANLGGLHLQGANSCRRRLQDAGFDAPQWGDCHVHKVDQWPDFLSLAALCLPSLGSMPRFSGFSLAAPLVPTSLCPVQVAGVAVHSTRVAITVQLVTSLGFWVTEGSPWKVQPLEFAARLELESP